jgi:outer membrane protein assembly factor BamB
MGSVVFLVALQAILGSNPDGPPASVKPDDKASTPELRRTIPLDNVRGASDTSGISGRIDHMRYDPETQRLFVACVANGSLEVIDLETGIRVGSISGLSKPQGVGVAAGWAFVATGDDGKLHRFNTSTLAAGDSVAVGDDADNVRIGGDGKVWVSFGGTGPGGMACFDAKSLALEKKMSLPKMPEGFQIHASNKLVFANMPDGKKSMGDGAVYGLNASNGDILWERKLIGHARNFPMTLDSANDRVFVASRNPARLICLSGRDGSILGETACPPESDDLFFDPPSGLVAVIGGGTRVDDHDPGGAGASLDLFTIDGSGRPTRLGGSPLPPHSRTGTLAVDRRAIYVAVPGAKDRPAEVREYRLPK